MFYVISATLSPRSALNVLRAPRALEHRPDPGNALLQPLLAQLHQSVLKQKTTEYAHVSDHLVVKRWVRTLVQRPVLKKLVVVAVDEQSRLLVSQLALKLVGELLQLPRLRHIPDHEVEIEVEVRMELPNALPHSMLVGRDEDFTNTGRNRHLNFLSPDGRPEAEVLEWDEDVVGAGFG